MPVKQSLELVVSARRMLTEEICEFEFRDPTGSALPAFEAGSHITLETPGGAVRSYSLTNDEIERSRYVIAVKLDPAGKGGSSSMHRDLQVGSMMRVFEPSNKMNVVEAPRYLLIAGGVGITPILSISRKLTREGHPDFHVLYLTRSADQMAYADEIVSNCTHGNVTIHHSVESPDGRFDLADFIKDPDGTNIYYCGPKALMNAIYALTIHWPRSTLHFEDFDGVSSTGISAQPFNVRQLSSDRLFEIPSDKTILEVFRGHGIQPKSSCETGTCGTCRVALVSGDPDHRDLVLSESERQLFFIPCVSRATSDEITLDI